MPTVEEEIGRGADEGRYSPLNIGGEPQYCAFVTSQNKYSIKSMAVPINPSER
jgi:hypothetical protein